MQRNNKPSLEMIEMCKKLNNHIDEDLIPIFSSGIWIIDGMVSSHRNDRKLMGNVNIGDRIFTNDTVTLLGNGKYKLTPKSDYFIGISQNQLSFLAVLAAANANPNAGVQKNENIVKATIDGKQYEGKVILVDKKDVYVDDIKMTNNQHLKTNKI